MAKYIGDGLLVYFGYPQAHEDDARRAVSAGLGIVEGIAALNRQLGNSHGVELSVRLGVHTGLVVAGEMGGGATREADAIVGETPNVAARLEALAAPNSVAISAATQRLVEGLFECDDLGPQRLKGVSRPVTVFRVRGESVAPSRFEAAAERGLTRLVGREEEIGLLLKRWEQAAEGEGQIVLLSGDAGVGKSRILRAFRERLEDESHSRVLYYCSAYHRNSALYPAIDQLERALRFARDEGPAKKLDKLEAVLGDLALPVADIAPILASLLSLPLEGRYQLLELAPQQLKARTLEANIAVIEAMAARAPVLMVVEDAHWIDPSTAELLGLLMERLLSARVLLVLTFRPEFEPPWSGQPHLTLHALNRLGRKETTAMVAEVTGGKALPDEVLDQIVAKTDGVPLYVEELTKTVLESGVLEETANGYVVTAPLQPLAIPASLQDSLMARLDRLAPVKEVAQLAAVLGRTFGRELLEAVSALDGAVLDDALGELVKSGLVYRRGLAPYETYEFKHALVQDAAYQSLLKSTRQQHHGRIAQVIEEGFPETAENEPEIVASHFTEAALAEKAVEYWRRAGERASTRSANAEAEVHLKQGLSLCEQMPEGLERERAELELHLLLGPVLLNNQGWASTEVGEVYTRADELCQRLDDHDRSFIAAWGLWINKQQQAKFETAIDIADRLLDIAQRDNNEEHILQAHHSAWTSRFAYEELESVIVHTEAGLRLYDKDRHRSHSVRYGGHDPGVCCRLMGGIARLIAGLPTQGRNLTVDSVDLARELDHPFSLALALSFSGTSHLFLGEPEQVATRMDELSQVVNIHGFAPIKPNLEMLRGWAKIAVDGDSSGIQIMEGGLAQLEKAGLNRLSFQLAILADAFRRLGSTEPAISAIDQAIDVVASTNERRWESEIRRLKGELLEASGAEGAPEAEAFYRRAMEVAQAQGAKWFELRAAASLARLWQTQKKTAEARDLLAPIYGWFTEGSETPDLKDAKALLDELN